MNPSTAHGIKAPPVWAHRESNTQADRRGSPRFTPFEVIPAAFGAPGWRFVGLIANISSTGVCIRFQNHLHPELAQAGAMVNVDFVLGDDVFMASAKLVRIYGERASLQFEHELSERSVQMFVERGRSSAVQWEPGRAIVHGSLGIKVLSEVLDATESGRVVDLRHVTQIDNDGIGLALLVLDRRGTLDSCHADIRNLLSSSGVCSQCAGSCDFSGKRK